MEKYFCRYAHKESYVPYEIMVERMVRSTFNSSNVYGVILIEVWLWMRWELIMVMQVNVQS